MAAEMEPNSEQLNKLIDALVSASDLAGTGDEQAIETALQCLHSLKFFKVRRRNSVGVILAFLFTLLSVEFPAGQYILAGRDTGRQEDQKVDQTPRPQYQSHRK